MGTSTRRQGGARETAAVPWQRRARTRWLLVVLATLLVGAAAWRYVAPRPDSDGDPVLLATLNTADFHALVFHPSDPQVVFFGHHNGVMRSEDGGRTWRPLVARTNFDAMGLAVDAKDPQTVYLAGHDTLQGSSDGGKSWRPMSHNLPGTDIHGFAISPDDPARHYAFVVGHGVFRSADRGAHWEPLGKPSADVMSLAAAGGNPETLFAGSMRGGLLRSNDGGGTWTSASSGLSGTVLAISVDPSERQNVYAGTDRGLYKSADAGNTWRALPFRGLNVATLAASPARPGLLLVISVTGDKGVVYRSEDGGESWR